MLSQHSSAEPHLYARVAVWSLDALPGAPVEAVHMATVSPTRGAGPVKLRSRKETNLTILLCSHLRSLDNKPVPKL